MNYNQILRSSPILIGLIGVLAFSAEDRKGATASKGKEKTTSVSAQPASTGTPIALTVEGIQEIEEKRKSLEEKEKFLGEKQKSLELQEKILKEKLSKMEELNKKMTERLDKFQTGYEAKIVKLVSVVEGMRPQAAAEYVENLDPDLAVEILARIQVLKVSKIMNLVDRKKAARLTELYTGYRQKIEEAGIVPASSSTVEGRQEVNQTPSKM